VLLRSLDAMSRLPVLPQPSVVPCYQALLRPCAPLRLTLAATTPVLTVWRVLLPLRWRLVAAWCRLTCLWCSLCRCASLPFALDAGRSAWPTQPRRLQPVAKAPHSPTSTPARWRCTSNLAATLLVSYPILLPSSSVYWAMQKFS
jgi:hypothetical protein